LLLADASIMKVKCRQHSSLATLGSELKDIVGQQRTVLRLLERAAVPTGSAVKEIAPLAIWKWCQSEFVHEINPELTRVSHLASVGIQPGAVAKADFIRWRCTIETA
jgi:hypothetical protein